MKKKLHKSVWDLWRIKVGIYEVTRKDWLSCIKYILDNSGIECFNCYKIRLDYKLGINLNDLAECIKIGI